MKKIIPIVLITVYALLLSCEQQEPQSVNKNDVSGNIVEKLQAAGFDTSEGLMPYKDGYLVEYDIFLTEAMINELVGQKSTGSNGRVEHYRTNNLITGLPRTITVYLDPSFDAYMQTAFSTALTRYNAQNLGLTFQSTTSASAASISILSFYEVSNVLGYSAGFPTGGNPASPIRLNTYYYNNTSQRADAATVIAHEIGHAIGFRHTDYMNRAFSCGTGGNEGDAGVGAVHIPGTPTTPSSGSWMLACSSNTDRPFTADDVVALATTYPMPLTNSGAEWLNGPFNYSGYTFLVADVSGDGKADIVGINAGDERAVVWTSTGTGFNSGAEWVNGPFNYSGHTFDVADVSGDGKADIIGINASDERAVVWTSTGTGFISGAEWVNGPFNYSGYSFDVADASGDGKADIVGFSLSEERSVVWVSNGSGFISGAEWVNGPFNYSGHAYEVADVSGDGKADIVGISPSDERAVVWVSTGSGFNSGAEWLNGPFNYSGHIFNLADANGDGKADIIGVSASDERILAWLSTGSGFISGAEWSNGPFNYSGYIFKAGNLNSDNKADVIGIYPSDERSVVWTIR